jgi:hypothetical protein
VNQISLYVEEGTNFETISFNGEDFQLHKKYDKASMKIKGKEIVRYYVSDNDSLEVSYTIKMEQPVKFTVMEYSFDLLSHSQFSINKRAENMMPTPFVITDAIAVKKKIDVGTLQLKISDTIQ